LTGRHQKNDLRVLLCADPFELVRDDAIGINIYD